MAKPDVLEVLDSQLDNLCVETPEDQAHFDALEDATLRIAELIAADVEYDAARRIHDALQDGVSTIGEEVIVDAGLRRANERRAAALAACRGLA